MTLPLSGVRGQGCFLTTFTALSTGSMTNFIPSGTSGTESIFRKANSEDRTTSALFNFDQLYLLVCVINGVFHTLGREGNAIHARIGEFRETLRHPSVVLNEFMQLNRHERLDGALESFNLHRLGLGGRRVRLARSNSPSLWLGGSWSCWCSRCGWLRHFTRVGCPFDSGFRAWRGCRFLLSTASRKKAERQHSPG